MTTVVITAHAAERYVERIAPNLTVDQAREAIRAHTAAILAAHAFHCRAVITGIGAKLVVDTGECGEPAVITVEHARNYRPPVSRRIVRKFGKLRRQRERGE